MNTKNSTKRALVASILALAMCFSMLVGTTLAWFTDSATSTGNVIETGTLKVDLEVLAEDNSAWSSVKANNDPIFNYTNWEPGYVQAKVLRVENEGSLALKWKAVLNGTVSELANVIDVYVKAWGVRANDNLDDVVYPDVRSDLDGYVKVGTLAQFIADIETTTVGTLLAGEKAYLGIAFKMQDTADDYYQDMTLGAFDLTILATQMAYEEDSFDNQYDANLDPNEDGIYANLDDGSTVFYYGEESVNAGKVILTDLPEDLGSEYVVPDEVNFLGNALVGATLDKLTIPASVEYAYKSLEGATIDEVVFEEGTTTIPNRMFYKMNVEKVVIPESVTALEESAFQQAYIKEIVVPATIDFIPYTAFAGTTLEKITFEAENLTIENRAMRECGSLRTVIFNCETVTFVNNTTYGDCWISNTGSNGANYSRFDIYTKNTDVAYAVRQAIIHEQPSTTPIYVGDAQELFLTAKNATEISNAIANATVDTIVYVTADITADVAFTQANNGLRLTILGNEHTMTGSFNITARASKGNRAALTIDGFNFETTDAKRDFIYSVENNRYPNNLTISNCDFEGTGPDSDVVAISVKTPNNLVVENCKANNVHSLLQNNNGGWGFTIKHCEVTNAGRGISLNSAVDVLIEDVKISAKADKYGIRLSAEYNTTVTIKDCEIDAFCAVVVRRASANYNIVFEGENVMTSQNTDGIWCAIGTSEYEANGSKPTAATGNVTVTLNDAGLDANGIYGAN